MINTHNFEKIQGKYINLREAQIEDSAFILSLRTDPNKSQFIHKTDNNLEKQEAYMRRYKTLDNEWYYIVENAMSSDSSALIFYQKHTQDSKNTSSHEANKILESSHIERSEISTMQNLDSQKSLESKIKIPDLQVSAGATHVHHKSTNADSRNDKKDSNKNLESSTTSESLGTQSIYPTYNTLALQYFQTQERVFELGRWIMSDKAHFLQSLESDFLLKVAFYETLNLDDKHIFTVKPDNKKVMQFHLHWGAKSIGFDKQEGVEVLLFTRQDFMKHRAKFEALLYR